MHCCKASRRIFRRASSIASFDLMIVASIHLPHRVSGKQLRSEVDTSEQLLGEDSTRRSPAEIPSVEIKATEEATMHQGWSLSIIVASRHKLDYHQPHA